MLDVTASTAQKIVTAKEKKDAGDQTFKQGNSKDGVL